MMLINDVIGINESRNIFKKTKKIEIKIFMYWSYKTLNVFLAQIIFRRIKRHKKKKQMQNSVSNYKVYAFYDAFNEEDSIVIRDR